MDRPLRVREIALADGTPALMTDGAPSDCVALALLGLLPTRPEVVVAGINPSANIGHDVTYSGTVTAAMEAVINGVMGVAVSLDAPHDLRGALEFGPAARAARGIVERLLAQRLPPGVLLNVNVPYLPDAEIKGLRLTRQGLRVYRDRLDRRADPRGRPYYWIGGDAPGGVVEDGTDYGEIARGYVSVTPLQLDLTAYEAIEALKGWEG
jgi:5'-nucleotidase